MVFHPRSVSDGPGPENGAPEAETEGKPSKIKPRRRSTKKRRKVKIIQQPLGAFGDLGGPQKPPNTSEPPPENLREPSTKNRLKNYKNLRKLVVAATAVGRGPLKPRPPRRGARRGRRPRGAPHGSSMASLCSSAAAIASRHPPAQSPLAAIVAPISSPIFRYRRYLGDRVRIEIRASNFLDVSGPSRRHGWIHPETRIKTHPGKGPGIHF